jgi:glycosyltransferase involved in cell wall biosynthesis
MKNPERAIAMGEQGRKRVVEEYSIAREAQGIDSVYEQLWKA